MGFPSSSVGLLKKLHSMTARFISLDLFTADTSDSHGYLNLAKLHGIQINK